MRAGLPFGASVVHVQVAALAIKAVAQSHSHLQLTLSVYITLIRGDDTPLNHMVLHPEHIRKSTQATVE
jgi:hypothetical protein